MSRVAGVFFMENSGIASFVSNAFEYFHHTGSVLTSRRAE
jgi:hypothetical protein